MANSEHITWLLEGVDTWNERHLNIPGRGYTFAPDFEGASLHRIFQDADKLDVSGRIPLVGADLCNANLSKRQI